MDSVQNYSSVNQGSQPSFLSRRRIALLAIIFFVLLLTIFVTLKFIPKTNNFKTQIGTNRSLNNDAKNEITSHLARAATATSELNKFFAYTNAFDQLLGQYSAKPDKATLATLEELKNYMAVKFPKEYQDYQKKGLARGFDPWFIKER